MSVFDNGGSGGGVTLANGVDDRVVTATGASALNGEANLTFDGTDLALTGNAEVSGRTQANIGIRVQNETVNTISKGTPVYVSSTEVSGRPSVAPADANGSGTYPSIGIAYEDISAGSSGFVLETGKLEDVPAAAFSGTDPAIGDTVYLSETAGKLTVDRPTNVAAQVQNVARIVKTTVDVNAGTGTAGVIAQNPGRTNDTPNSSTRLFLLEQSSSVTSTAAYGQIWVKNTAPTELYFTTDAGNDIQITSGTGVAGGGVAADDENLILHMQTFA